MRHTECCALNRNESANSACCAESTRVIFLLCHFTIVVVVVVVVVFTLKAVPVSTQYFLASVLVQLTRTPSVVTG